MSVSRKIWKALNSRHLQLKAFPWHFIYKARSRGCPNGPCTESPDKDINKDDHNSPGWDAGDKRIDDKMAEEMSEREIQSMFPRLETGVLY